MSRRIAKLLGEPEAEVTELLSCLENKNGSPSHDARHIAQVHQRVRAKLADLNLDPDDTTAQELYHALASKFEADSQEFDAAHNVANNDFDSKTAAAAKLLKSSGQLPNLWALKNKTAKEILAAHTPKQVMKYLGYRSVASLLKREDVSEIYIAAQQLESAGWQKQQARLISKLQPTAFELREVNVILLDYDRWLETASQDDVVVCDETGSLAVWPSEQVGQAPLLSISLLLIKALQQYEAGRPAAKDVFSADSVMAWWSDMDHLVVDLDGGPVSLNIHDVAGGWLNGGDFAERELKDGRKNYWQQLIEKYESKDEIEALFDNTVMQKVRQLKFSAPEPAFEYDFAEDFLDG